MGEDSSVVVRFAARLCKSGGTLSECEDAFIHYDAPNKQGIFRASVADGATEGIFSGEWADMLCRGFAEEGNRVLSFLPNLQTSWKRFAESAPLPWYAEAKREQGAYAALLGVEANANGSLELLAVGDSAAFLVRQNALVLSFPVSRAADFDSLPWLIGTHTSAQEVYQETCSWEKGDDLFLMSDALGQWFLREVEQKREPWQWLVNLESGTNSQTFEAFIAERRVSGKLRNDDTTLIHLRFSE